MRVELPNFRIDFGTALPSDALNSKSQLPAALKGFQKRIQSKEIGFYDWPNDLSTKEIEALATRAAFIEKNFEGALLLGIGGSYLGAYALMNALGKKRFPLHWVSNTDGPAIREAENFAKKHKSAAIVISKSGGTTETLSAFYHLSPALDEKGFTIITDPKSGELRRLVDKYGWTSFPVPPNIGGRFSVLTAVGLLPLFLAGLDVKGLIEGARAMKTFLDSKSPDENPAALFALMCRHWEQAGKNLHVYMPYEQRLKSLGDWAVQLWAESLGKKGKGFTPVAALGTSDQHSLLQLFKEGPSDKVIGFIDVTEGKTVVGKPKFETGSYEFLCGHSFETINHRALEATRKSLSHLPTYCFTFDKVDEKSLGAFLFFHETACAIAGELYGVDAFNQPGVEEAKKLLRQSL